MWYMKELFEVTDVDAAAHLGERREYHGCRCQEGSSSSCREKPRISESSFQYTIYLYLKDWVNLDSAEKGEGFTTRG